MRDYIIQPGTVLGNTYVVQDQIGSGGGGLIYRAYHQRLRTTVVIKQIKDNIRDLVNVRAEVDLLKGLRHSNLPQVYDFLEIGGNIYTVMEYIPGENLGKHLEKYGPYSQELILRWAEQLTDALVYLHTRKPPIIHSDIKPENIMLTPDGSVCLIDFNISGLAQNGRIQSVGISPGYSPPEQYTSLQRYLMDMAYARRTDPGFYGMQPLVQPDIRHIGELVGSGVDERSDILSLGATLYTLCTGKRPEITDVMYFPAFARNSGISQELSSVIGICMNPEPSERFQSAAQLQQALKHLERYSAGFRKKQRRFRIAAAACALTVFLVGGAVLAGLHVRAKNSYRKYEELVEEGLSLQREDYEKSLDLLDDAAELMPGEPEAHLARMSVMNNHLDYENTLDYALNTVLEEVDDIQEDGQFSYLLAEAYEGLGSFEEAVEYYGDAAELTGEESYQRDYIMALIRSGDTETAEKELDSWKDNNSDPALENYFHAMIAQKKGDLVRAKEEARQGFSSCQDSRLRKNLVLLLADVYRSEYRNGDTLALNDELDILKEAAGQDRDFEVTERYADTLSFCGREKNMPDLLQEADRVYGELLSEGYDRPYLYQNIAILREQTGDMEGAEEILEKMRERWPGDYRTWYQSGMTALDRELEKPENSRDYADAIVYYQKACELTANTPEAQEIAALADRLHDLGLQ